MLHLLLHAYFRDQEPVFVEVMDIGTSVQKLSMNSISGNFMSPNPAKYYKTKFHLYQKYSQWNLVLILQYLVVLSVEWQEHVKFTFLCDLGKALFPDLEWNLRRKEFIYQFHKFRKPKVLRLKQSGTLNTCIYWSYTIY